MMNLRLEALKLAVASQGNPNKLGLAKEYLEFLEEPAATVAVDVMLSGPAATAAAIKPAKQGKQPK
jgi:precorrin-3B methylase